VREGPVGAEELVRHVEIAAETLVPGDQLVLGVVHGHALGHVLQRGAQQRMLLRRIERLSVGLRHELPAIALPPRYIHHSSARKYVSIGPLPRISTVPRGSSANRPSSRWRVAAERWMRPDTECDSIRLAVFTVSPHT